MAEAGAEAEAAERWSRQPPASLVSGNGPRVPLGEQMARCVERWCAATRYEAGEGDTQAMLQLAKFHLEGYGTCGGGVKEARRWARRAEAAGNPHGLLFQRQVDQLYGEDAGALTESETSSESGLSV